MNVTNVQSLLTALNSVGDFMHWHERFRAIEGWLHDLEGYALYLLAAQGPGLGAIVEIGSYLGRSTAWLAAGSKSAGREKVWAVDHFRGSPEHQAGERCESRVLLQESTTYVRFLNNLRQAGLGDFVEPIVATSEEAAARWQNPVRLLFIDGDHSYASVQRDFTRWAGYVVAGGLICFHDATTWPGVAQFYRDVIGKADDYREIATVVSMKIVQKAVRGEATLAASST